MRVWLFDYTFAHVHEPIHQGYEIYILLHAMHPTLGGCAVTNSAKISSKLHETIPQDCAYFLEDAQQAAQPVIAYVLPSSWKAF